MNSPVLDAELHSQEPKRDYYVCDICGERIYKEDDVYEGDIYYDFDGEKVCEECLSKYARRFKCRA